MTGQRPFKDVLVDLALAGDAAAAACIKAALPEELPAQPVRAYRNRQILAAAAVAKQALRGVSDRRIATIVWATGDALQRARNMTVVPALSALASPEQAELRRLLEPLIAMGDWPVESTIRRIVTGSNFARV